MSQRRFDSVPRADAAAGAVMAGLLLGASATQFDSWALPQVAREDANPFEPGELADTMQRDLKVPRRDGASLTRAYANLSFRLLEAHMAGQGYQAVRQDGSRIDANETPFLPRDLKFVQSTPREEIFPQYKSRLFVPISHEAPPGATTVTYREMHYQGEAKLLGTGTPSPKDIPRADVHLTEQSVNVRTIACAYGYSLQELAAAAMLNRPLPAWKAKACALAHEQKLDSILFSGDSDAGLTGFNSLTGVTDEALPLENWIAGGVSGANILIDLNDLMSQGKQAQSDAAEWEFDTVVMPLAQYEHIRTMRLDTAGDAGVTVLEAFKKNYPGVSVHSWTRLSTAGAASATRAIAYRKSNLVVQAHIPQEMTALAPQQEGFEYVVYCYSRVGGCEFPYPLAMRYSDGI